MNTIALIGLSGTGKSTVGRLLAAQLGLPLRDTDAMIVEATGQTVAALFASEGEAAFRDRETAALQQALTAGGIVATGGGAVLRPENRDALRAHAFIVWLDAPVDALVARLNAHDEIRPLLAEDTAARLMALHTARAHLYAETAHLHIDTTAATPADSARQIGDAARTYRLPDREPAVTDTPLTIRTPAGEYAIVVGEGVLARLPSYLHDLGLVGTCWLVADDAVAERYAAPLLTALRDAGRRAELFRVPSGEGSKSLEHADALYTWLIGGGVERRDTLLALGGGVVGDLAGFIAATILRGIAVVQLPTTLLAMVDSAIGGKTGINHPLGKNLIGAFHQPRLVLSDVATLASLPPRELRAGWAEVIKHGVIRDAGLFAQLEAMAAAPTPTPGLIRRAAAVKVDVVNIDEREMAERMLLNYGHTLGHAIEAAAGYGALLHGEAVAIGMELAGQIAVELGMFPADELERQRALIHAYGLSTSIPPQLDTADLLARTLRDKKVQAGTIRWVLPVRIGEAVVRRDVPPELVQRVVMRAR